MLVARYFTSQAVPRRDGGGPRRAQHRDPCDIQPNTTDVNEHTVDKEIHP